MNLSPSFSVPCLHNSHFSTLAEAVPKAPIKRFLFTNPSLGNVLPFPGFEIIRFGAFFI